MSASSGNRKKKRILWLTTIVLFAGISFGVFYINSLIPIITGYPAKYLCSAVFNSNRLQADVEALDLNFSFIRYTHNEVNFQDSSVTSSFLWGKSKAVFREGFGSTLLRETDEETLRNIQFPTVEPLPYNPDSLAWPMGNLLPPPAIGGIDTLELAAITHNLMIHNAYNGNAFAFLVLHKGLPVAESYKPPFHLKTHFQSWSMAKSFTNALVGTLVNEGKLDIWKPVNLLEWQNDERNQITINHLMQMESGLKWNEEYGTRSDVTVMLYGEHDFARYAYRRPLEFPVGSKWFYSSGSVNIINYLMRQTIRDDDLYYNYANTSLFHKIGIRGAVFEVDASGTQVGSSYIYASARDYARLGLLYLQDGMYYGQRILPEGWVKYSTTAAAQSEGAYGSLFWLNRNNHYPSLPEDMYSSNGHEGQRLFIIPSKDLVVVVLGYSPKPDNLMDFETLLGDIIHTIN